MEQYLTLPLGDVLSMLKTLLHSLEKSTNSVFEAFSPLYDKLFYFPGDKSDHLAPDTDISNVEKYELLSSRGEKISIWHLKTKLHLGPQRGIVVHCHGSGFNNSSHFPHVSWLPDHGYDVIMFDYPGYGSSEGIPDRTSTVSAAKDVISHFGAISPVEMPLFVLGQSLGGNIASVALTHFPQMERISGVILDSMYSSFKALGAAKIRRKYLKYNIFGTYFASHLVASFISNTDSPLSHAGKLRLPALILHSRNDYIVPIQESINFYSRMKSSDVEFWSHLNSGHTDVLQNNLSGYREKVLSWMDEKAKKVTK